MSRWRLAALACGLLAYALLANWLMRHAAQQPWALAVLAGPFLLALAVGAWRQRKPWLLAACGVALVLAAGAVASQSRLAVQWLLVLEHAGFHLAGAAVFGVSLRPGATPLITAFARRLHAHFSEEERRYTVWVTQLWAGYFLAMTLLSLVLFALAPWPWWSAFATLLTPLAAAALFGGEYLLRFRRHPHFERVSLRTVIATLRREGGLPGAPRP
jgi:uncharacterized membrane protein